MGILLVSYLFLIALSYIPAVQRALSAIASKQISSYLHTEIRIGRIDLGLFNRIILDDVSIKDQNNQNLLSAARLATKIEIIPLLNGQITLSNIQIYGFDINLYKKTIHDKPNFQFLIDAFSKKEKKKEKSIPNLKLNSILIRRGMIAYNRLDAPKTPGKFNPEHVSINHFSATIALKKLSKDSLNLNLKNLRFNEHSGLTIKQFRFKIRANQRHAILDNLMLQLPNSRLSIDSVTCDYPSWNNQKPLKDLLYSLDVNGNIAQSSVVLEDLKPLVPAFSKITFPITISTHFSGNNDLFRTDRLEIKGLDDQISLNTSIIVRNLFTPSNQNISAQIKSLHIEPSALTEVIKTISPDKKTDKANLYLSAIGQIQLTGHIEKKGKASIASLLDIQTDAGPLYLDGSYTQNGRIQVTAKTKGLDMDSLSLKQFRHIAFNMKCNGYWQKGHQPDLSLSGEIPELTYKNYTYQNIKLDGQYSAENIKGKVSVNDPNIQFEANGSYDKTSRRPKIKLNGRFNHFNPNALSITKKHPDTYFSFNIDANLNGQKIDDITGYLYLDDFKMESRDEIYNIRHLHLTSNHEHSYRQIDIHSDFLQARLKGEFNFSTLFHNGQKILHHYIPTFIKSPGKSVKGEDILSLEANIYNLLPLEKILEVPIHITSPGRVEGYFNSSKNNLRFFTSIPEISYNDQDIKDIGIFSTIQDDSILCGANMKKMVGKSLVEFQLRSKASHDLIQTRLYWDNHRPNAYKGTIYANTRFSKDENNTLRTNITFLPSEVTVNDSIWQIHHSDIEIRPKHISVDNFKIDQERRHLILNGEVGPHIEDSLIVDLNDINLEYIFNIINFHTVDFTGRATGRVYATNLLHSPLIDARLNVKNFCFNNAYLGEADIHGGWEKENNAIFLNANMEDHPNQSRTNVKGTIVPGHKPQSGLELKITTERIDLSFLNKYTAGIFSDLQGRGTGWVRVFGPFKAINLEGDMLINEGDLKVGVTNVAYHLENDSVILRPDNIYFRNAKVYDHLGHPGRNDHYGVINGVLRHTHLSNLRYNVTAEAYNILGYDQKDFGEEAFCGTVYATGHMSFNGRPGMLNINIDARPEANTVFTYNLSTPSALTSNQFITYAKATDDSVAVEKKTASSQINEPESDMRLNFNLNVTPDATMKILMDPKAGDYVAVNGQGNIRATYYNKGDFMMYGSYRVNNGVYKLSLQDVIRKDFVFSPGGTISFNGSPTQADLNLQAVYTVPSVSLNDLSARSTFSQNNVRVNCIMNLTGKASSPKIGFDFDLPNVNEDEKQMVRSLISTEEEKNMQVIYLLGIGRFYTYDYNNTEQSQSSVAMKSLISSTLSGQLNQMFSSILGNNSNWNIGTNLSTGDQGWSDMDIEGLLSGRLLNNRLLINGNFGYRDNTTTASNFIGDFDLQWLLTPSGNISLKAYSKTNDRYFTKSSLTTQGIGIAVKRDFNTWRDVFKIFIPKKRRFKQDNQPATTGSNR